MRKDDMMIDHVLAVIAVADIDQSRRWYSEFFGRPPDNNPMPNLVEWQVRAGAWIQVFIDPQRAGRGLFNIAVDDLEDHLASLRDRGLEPGEIVDAAKGVRLSEVKDPDGNEIRIIGGFRVKY